MRDYIKQAPRQDRSASAKVEETVRRMLADIEDNRDDAVRRYARELDKWEGPEFKVSQDRIAAVTRAMPETFKEDFAYCLRQVTGFARHQRDSMREFEIETEPGIRLGQKLIPVARVGCYIPGGKYPLVAAAIMSVATARTAGVEKIVGCAPPRDAEGIFAPTLYALHAAGADEIYVLGGVQAMAAMAYGCLGMEPVDMITGPGIPMSPRLSGSCSARWGSTCWPGRPRS